MRAVSKAVIAAVALSIAGGATAHAVERPDPMRTAKYDLTLQRANGSFGANVKLTWVNGYHGRVEVSWSTPASGAGVSTQVEIDGRLFTAQNGNKVRTPDGDIYRTVRVRVCESGNRCGSWK